MTEAQHYKAKASMYRALCFSMITRLEADESLMRDLIKHFRELEQSPEYNSPQWREAYGIPFD